MKINEIKKEDLELMSYNDITEIMLEENKEQSTADLFKKIVQLLELPASTFENKVGDFYTSLANDKRFILLDNGKWDLRKNHKVKNIIVEEDLDDIDSIDSDDTDDLEMEEEPDEIYMEDSDDDVSDITEEYKDLVIVDEEDLEQE